MGHTTELISSLLQCAVLDSVEQALEMLSSIEVFSHYTTAVGHHERFLHFYCLSILGMIDVTHTFFV